MNVFLFDSHSLEALADELSTQICLDGSGLFAPSLVAIAHPSMKEWIQIELCKRSQKGAVVGLEFVSPRRLFQKFFKNIPSRSDLAAAIWAELAQNPPEECKPFLQSERKSIDFVSHLTSLFVEYCEYRAPQAGWQKNLFEEIFASRGWITYADALKLPQPAGCQVYFFGIDLMPPAALQVFLGLENSRFFRFSPCAMFWEDFCSNAERKRMLKKKAGSTLQMETLDSLLRESQPLLSNWGMAVRKMLTLSPEVTAENYEIEESDTQLYELKLDLLLSEQERRNSSADSSLRCIQAGSSKLQEVQMLREEILKLKIPFSEIRVYAPDIGPYAPLIEFCFSDIPFRIAGLDLAKQSHFFQGLQRLFACVGGRWEAEEILSLFEMSSFYRKVHWNNEELKKVRDWIERAKVRWGLDGEQRPIYSGSWKAGFDVLFDSWIYFQKEKEYGMNWSDADLFEDFYQTFDSLRKRISSWKKNRTLVDWSREIEELSTEYLFIDEDLEADRSAQKAFVQSLSALKGAPFESEEFPFSFVQMFFFSSIDSEVGGSALHGIRFGSLELGAVLPAKAIFLMGMDEESFPRSSSYSSLRLPSDCPSRSEQDRYLFLSTIFAAKEKLVFSYCHRSAEDGKQVSPSLLIQELFGYLKNGKLELYKPHSPTSKERGSLLSTSKELPKEASLTQISVQELSRFLKHPFQYYLKNVLGIDLRDETESAWEEFEFSGLTRYLALQGFLEGDQPRELSMPLGLFGKTAENELESARVSFSNALSDWGIAPESIHAQPIDLKIDGVMLSGEVPLVVPGGILYMGGDSIGSLLRKWVEILSVLAMNGTGQIYFLKTGKVKQVVEPLKALQSVIDLYLRSQEASLFLHPDWADLLLRKGLPPERDTSEDRVMEWVLARSPGFDLKGERDLWQKTLLSAFVSLSAIYPTRGGYAEV